MSPLPGSYSFLPYARQGLGVHISKADQDTTVLVRGSIDVGLRVKGVRIGGGDVGELVPRAVQIYGPGEVIGIDTKAIVRTEPRHWITNFEPNYLPFVEFYDEDFPWRYTPAAPSPDKRRLRPWLTLVVLEEPPPTGPREFEDHPDVFGRPLPYITVGSAGDLFPAPATLWAWAHVHVNGAYGSGGDPTALAGRLEQTVRDDRDQAYSRLLCPRILKPNTGYHAFVIPTFETGRLAGLGKDPAGAAFATQSAWGAGQTGAEANDYPYYHRWYFRSGMVGDFEYLVRLLQPRTVDPRVGRRDMDTIDPGLHLPQITHRGNVLPLGGALLPPDITLDEAAKEKVALDDAWARKPSPPFPPHPFQTALAAVVNLADDYGTLDATSANSAVGPVLEPGNDVGTTEDPLIVPPLYGRWHGLVTRLDPVAAIPPDDAHPDSTSWVHELNLDPRHRVAAGFGTSVVQKNQEDYMEAAWKQVGKVLEANLKIRFAQMAKAAAAVWHGRELVAIQATTPERFLAIAAPVQRRIVHDGLTVHHLVAQSQVPTAALSTTMRRMLRPGGRFAKMLTFDTSRSLGNLIERLNAGEVSAAPPKVIAPGLPTGGSVADRLRPKGIPAFIIDWLKQWPWVRFVPLVVAVLLAILLGLVFGPVGILIGGVLLALGVFAFFVLDRVLKRLQALEALHPDDAAPGSVDELPTSPNFAVGTPGISPAPRRGSSDSAEAVRFKGALRNLYTLDAAERAILPIIRRPLDLAAIGVAMVDGLRPSKTIPARLFGTVEIPSRIADQLVATPADSFDEIMVYPEIDLPMYEPLKDISSELFLPNIQLIENNSITLLETNQKFIEAYMVGLNHEFARELVWREYPSDSRGSYFRQFWDVRSLLLAPTADSALLRERLRDIPELHTWPPTSPLGAHDNRETQGRSEQELVLVIRGELLKKYPTAVVYAHRAAWERDSAGAIDKTQPRRLAGQEGNEASPPPELMKTPLYEAKVDPDLTFLGFDITAEVARGGPVLGEEDDPGWFFVIKERPGEPRFGLDIGGAAPRTHVTTWSDLAWSDVNPAAPAEPKTLTVGVRTVEILSAPTPVDDLVETQWVDDKRFTWRADTHSAELAYILYQLPVLMAVHAAEMLKEQADA
jgi:hypothetical protein